MDIFANAANVFGDAGLLLKFLVTVFLKGLVFLSVVSFVLWLLRNNSASIRHLIISYSLAFLIMIPLITLAIPSWNVPLISEEIFLSGSKSRLQESSIESVINANADQETNNRSDNPASVSGSNERQNNSLTDTKSGSSFNVPGLIIIFWIVISFLILTWQLMGRFKVQRMVKRSKEVDSEIWVLALNQIIKDNNIKKQICLMVSDEVKVPVAVGLIEPKILIPDYAINWPQESVKTILLHEIAHLKRHDSISQIIAQIACVLHWFNPLVWIATFKLFIERERAADDYVLNGGIKVSAYVKHLIDASENVKLSNKPALDVAAMARGTDFKDRMLCILDPAANRKHASLSVKLMIAMLIVLFVIPLSAFSPWIANPPVTIDGQLALPGTSIISNQEEYLALPLNNVITVDYFGPEPGKIVLKLYDCKMEISGDGTRDSEDYNFHVKGQVRRMSISKSGPESEVHIEVFGTPDSDHSMLLYIDKELQKETQKIVQFKFQELLTQFYIGNGHRNYSSENPTFFVNQELYSSLEQDISEHEKMAKKRQWNLQKKRTDSNARAFGMNGTLNVIGEGLYLLKNVVGGVKSESLEIEADNVIIGGRLEYGFKIDFNAGGHLTVRGPVDGVNYKFEIVQKKVGTQFIDESTVYVNGNAKKCDEEDFYILKRLLAKTGLLEKQTSSKMNKR